MWYIAVLTNPNASSNSLNITTSMAMSHGLKGRLPRHWIPAQDKLMPTDGASKSHLADEHGSDTDFQRLVLSAFYRKEIIWQ